MSISAAPPPSCAGPRSWLAAAGAAVIFCLLTGCAAKPKVIESLPVFPALGGAASSVAAEDQTMRQAMQLAPGDPLPALESYVTVAESSSRRLQSAPGDADALRNYNFAVARIIGIVRDSKLSPWSAPIGLGSRTLAWKRDPDPDRNPAHYELIPADQLDLHGELFAERTTKAGLGAPIVAKRVADQAHENAPTPHFFYTATAVARFEGARCVMALEYPLKTETVKVGGRHFPLAADFTAPLALMLVEMHPEKQGMPRLLHPAKYADTTRIARLEPFDPNKTVVLVVHGLMSSPATWYPLINHLRADEQIRHKYQFWLFSYPSGYPYSYSAALLRRELDHAEERYPSNKKLVVIGHSMGGCISRLLITDSERRIWDQMFTVPPEKMDVSPEHKHILTESTIFEHRPEIGRVIFVSSPLRGADLAKGWLGSLGARLVKLPSDFLSIGKEEIQYARKAAGHQHLDRFPDSVDTLNPDNDFVRALHTVPLKSGIPHHTIAGDRGRGNAPNSSDGIVPYWSSHLPTAASEKIVPSHHGAHEHPDGIAEVRRILNLHGEQP